MALVNLEDQTATLDLIVRPRVYKRCRAAVHTAVLFFARGCLGRRGQLIHHINTRTLQNFIHALPDSVARSDSFH